MTEQFTNICQARAGQPRPASNGMGNEIEQFKVKLRAEKEKLEGELTLLGRRTPNNPNDWEAVPPETEAGGEPDPNVTADMVEGFEEATAVEGELEQRLSEVTAALGRIESGTYGTCKVCQNQIETDRLNANPAAATCIGHKNEPR